MSLVETYLVHANLGASDFRMIQCCISIRLRIIHVGAVRLNFHSHVRDLYLQLFQLFFRRFFRPSRLRLLSLQLIVVLSVVGFLLSSHRALQHSALQGFLAETPGRTLRSRRLLGRVAETQFTPFSDDILIEKKIGTIREYAFFKYLTLHRVIVARQWLTHVPDLVTRYLYSVIERIKRFSTLISHNSERHSRNSSSILHSKL